MKKILLLTALFGSVLQAQNIQYSFSDEFPTVKKYEEMGFRKLSDKTYADLYYRKGEGMIFKTALLALGLVCTSTAYAGANEACKAAGGVFQDAMLAEALRFGFNESHDWKRVIEHRMYFCFVDKRVLMLFQIDCCIPANCLKQRCCPNFLAFHAMSYLTEI